MSASVVARAAVGTMVGTSRRAGVDAGEGAGVGGLEVGTEGARMVEVTVGGCPILDGEGGEHHLDRLDVGTRHRTGGNSFYTSASISFFLCRLFFSYAVPYLCLCSMVVVSIVHILLLST